MTPACQSPSDSVAPGWSAADGACAVAKAAPTVTRARFMGVVNGLAALALLVLWSGVVNFIVQERQQALRELEQRARATAGIARAVLARAIHDYDRDLLLLRELVIGHGPDSMIKAGIVARLEGNPEIMEVLVLDPAGQVIHWSRDEAKPDLGDRDYFTTHRDSPGDGLHVSRAMESRIDRGKPFFALSRRISAPDGRFLGAVVLILSVDQVAENLGRLVTDTGTSLLVANLDGTALFRFPRSPGDSGRLLPEIAVRQGAFPELELLQVVSPFDGRVRVVAQSRVEDYPLVVGAAQDKEAALQALQAMALLAVGVGLLATVVLLLVAREITRLGNSRFTAVEALEAERLRLAGVIEGTNVGTWEWNPQTRETSFNERWAEMLGYRLEELQPTTINTWSQLVHPDDMPRCSETLQRHMSGELAAYDCEHRLRHRDGSWIWVHDRGKVIARDEMGRPSLLAGTHTDITAAKRAEEERAANHRRLTELLGYLSEGVFGVDRDGCCTWINPAALALLGRTEAEVLGVPVATFFLPVRPDGQPFVPQDCPVRRTLVDGKRRAGDQWFAGADGQALPVYLTVTPIRSSDGAITGAAGAFHDVVGRLKAEADLQRSNAELEQFAYVASHDLRQPLRQLSSFVTLLCRDYGPALDDEGREMLDYVRSAAQRMDSLIVDLLEYSRIGRKERPFEPVSLDDVVAAALQDHSVQIQETGADILVTGPLPEVLGDRVELHRLVQNLLGNALKYCPADRAPRIRIQADRVAREWHLAISDNGIGIEEGQEERIFGIFQRLHGRGEYDGTGIGLAVCRKIAQHHGARIWVRSAAGQGSTFFVAFPVSAGQGQQPRRAS